MSFEKAINHGRHSKHGEAIHENSKMLTVLELRNQG